MSIKSVFTIKDLENLSGIKAHTIRIWEKRYDLLQPERTDTNIRRYSPESLQKLLNVALLIEQGFKVSKIATFSPDELYKKVRELMVESKQTHHALNAFKLAMLNFDQPLFDQTYNKLLTQHSFRDIFLKVFLELLEEIGLLWLTNTITPAHEHFISVLIKQKLLLNIERVQNVNTQSDKTFVLFLPVNEIHDLGLLYVHFELLLKGYRSIYLGPSVPLYSLHGFEKMSGEIEFVSYFTILPAREDMHDYLSEINDTILTRLDSKFHILGKLARDIDVSSYADTIMKYDSLIEMIDQV
jgi:DNA-binding transcriptional MerR regulator